MRMQKTAMEFVEFDAQDVIMTSWYQVNMFAHNSLLDNYNNIKDPSLPSLDLGSMDGNIGLGYLYNSTVDNGVIAPKIYLGSSKKDTASQDIWNKFDVDVSMNGAVGDQDTIYNYRQANSVQDIIDWITANYMPQQ